MTSCLLIYMHINDISADMEFKIRLFADDCVCYREIKDIEDTLKLQRDIDRLGNWTSKLGISFQLSHATDNTEHGRAYHMLVPKVDSKPKQEELLSTSTNTDRIFKTLRLQTQTGLMLQ